MEMVRIAGKADIPEGQMKGYSLGNKQILVANVGGNYYAVDAICTHMRGYLPSGKLQGNIVICPVHGAQYDVTTGKVHKNVGFMFKMTTRSEAEDLKKYDLVVEGDDIKILA